MSITSSFPVSRGRDLVLAAAGPIAIGAVLAARTHHASPILAAPAIVFGVVAATSPALYIALAATGQAPPLAQVMRGLATAIGAFGVALTGLILPAAFLALSSLYIGTALAAVSGAIAAAGLLGLRRLAIELRTPSGRLIGSCVFLGWAVATAAIAGRLWLDLATEVTL